jgi:eukaryotic-like serine/threonine-protein kinase
MRIGSGGMAQVWIARRVGEHGFERLVAIKAIRPEFTNDASFREMFMQEARLAARIRHTNVVDIVDLGVEDDVLFQVMTLVDGDSAAGLLGKWFSTRGDEVFPLEVAVRMATDSLRGLHAAHELRNERDAPLGLVHRDVSPQNLLVGLDGVTKIADFGIAKALGRKGPDSLEGHVKGKIRYMSPEQLASRPLDRRSDVFSAGIVLWELLCCRRLFNAESIVSVIDGILKEDIPDPRSLRPDIPTGIAHVCMRALERDPGRRWQTAEQMADALEDASSRHGLQTTSRRVAVVVSELVGDAINSRKQNLRTIPEHAMEIRTGSILAVTSPTLAAPTRRDPPRPDAAPPDGSVTGVVLTRRSPPTDTSSYEDLSDAIHSDRSPSTAGPRAPHPPPAVIPPAQPAAVGATLRVDAVPAGEARRVLVPPVRAATKRSRQAAILAGVLAGVLPVVAFVAFHDPSPGSATRPSAAPSIPVSATEPQPPIPGTPLASVAAATVEPLSTAPPRPTASAPSVTTNTKAIRRPPPQPSARAPIFTTLPSR